MKTALQSRITYDKSHNIFDVCKTVINSEHLGNSIILPNICNIKSSTFHNGFASELASTFPLAIKNYELLTNQQKQLGYCQIVDVLSCKNNNYNHKVYVANMMCQVGFNSKGSRARNINYSSLAMCLLKIDHFIKNHLPSKEDSKTCAVYAHKYLVNYVGADSRFISYLLEDSIKNNSVTIYLK